MTALNSHTTGQIFESTAADIALGLLPTTPLPNDHPFQLFFQTHLTAITKPGIADPFIDACVAVQQGDHQWRRKASSAVIISRRQNMRNLLHQQPPDIIIVDQDISKGYGFHDRTQSLWPFICITKHYVTNWIAAEGPLKLHYEAILKASINHEFGHWLFTIVRNITKALHKLLILIL